MYKSKREKISALLFELVRKRNRLKSNPNKYQGFWIGSNKDKVYDEDTLEYNRNITEITILGLKFVNKIKTNYLHC